MKKDAKIYVAGHTGMVGTALVRLLKKEGYNNLVFRDSSKLDLKNQEQVHSFFETEKPEFVFLAAAKVGGVVANNIFRADFLYENLMIECNVIHAAYKFKVKKLLFLGSPCIYPKFAEQPIKETSLLTSSLEQTNEPYAVAKIAGLKLCENYRRQYGCNFISVMPTNLYGLNDNYDLKTSHVLPALLKKFHDAKVNNLASVEVWGTGTPKREFLHVDDLAEACLFLMKNYNEMMPINIGTGNELSIKELALIIKNIIGYNGNIFFNTSKPDGTPRKLLDTSVIHKMGWHHRINLRKGVEQIYRETFLNKKC